MKIALLQADHVPSHRHAYSGGNYPEMFANLFLKTATIIDMDVYDVTLEEYPTDYDQYDGFVITGSKATTFERLPWIVTLEQKIHQIVASNKKIVGICFGHQMLAQSFGGAVRRSDFGWGIGVQTVEMLEQKAWMEPYYEHLSLLFYHQDQVMELPPDAELLGTTDYCPVQMFCIDNQVLGIQAHPEMLRAHNHILMLEHQEHIKTQFQSAMDSLRIRDHSVIVGHWIVNFLQY